MKRLNFKTQGNVIKIFLFSLLVTACSYGDDISTLTKRVKNLEDAVSNLRAAYNDGKIISSVNAISEGSGGYVIAFSDGTSLNLMHGNDGNGGIDGQDGVDGKDGINGKDGVDGKDGADGVTPMIKIDEDGYWCVSYDDGMTYSRILDASGNPILATGSAGSTGNKGDKGDKGDTGDKGDKGDTGDKGEQGEKGDSGICVKVVIVDGLYVFQLYSLDDPNTIIESIKTPYTSNPAHVLQSIVEDQENGVIMLTMADGTAFKFNLDVSYPSSIVLLTDHISVSGQEHTATFEFRINPSNSYINFVFDGSNPNIELDQISITRAGDADSYVTKPSNYKIIDVSPSFNEAGERKVGQYTVKVSSESQDTEGEEIVALVITTKDGRGNKIQISSTLMTVEYDTRHPQIYGIRVGDHKAAKIDDNTFSILLPSGIDTQSLEINFDTNSDVQIGDDSTRGGVDLSNPVKLQATVNGETREFTLITYFSSLPFVYVNTPAPIISKDEWVANCTLRISNTDNYDDTYTTSVKGRGNSTWSYPKKPYAIKLDNKVAVLGMPKHKRWCLLANWMDRTNIRNAVALKIGSILDGLEWTPKGEFVNLIFNGESVGNYFLCEQIKIDKNRVNIDELKETDLEESTISGGYLLELDSYYDEAFKFRTDILNLPVNLKSPDEDVPAVQLDYIKNYFNDVEGKLNSHADYSLIESLIDIDSFIDWWLLYEIVWNGEPGHPKSSYMYKKRGGKLYAGPAWDFDWGTFTSAEGWCIKSAIWYRYLFTYEEFIIKVKERWNIHKVNLSGIPDDIDLLDNQITQSSLYDCQRWPINQNINGDETLPFLESVSKLKSIYQARYNWIDENISNLAIP